MEVTFNVNTDRGSFRKTIDMDALPRKGNRVFIANCMLVVDNLTFIPEKSKVIVYLWREKRVRATLLENSGWTAKKN